MKTYRVLQLANLPIFKIQIARKSTLAIFLWGEWKDYREVRFCTGGPYTITPEYKTLADTCKAVAVLRAEDHQSLCRRQNFWSARTCGGAK